jgi:transposase-like protein
MYNYFIILNTVNATGEVQILGLIITNKDSASLKNGFQSFVKVCGESMQPMTVVIDSDPGMYEAASQVFPHSTIVFSRFHIVRRVKKLFKDQPALREKALRMVTTDLFLKDFLDLSSESPTGNDKDVLSYD